MPNIFQNFLNQVTSGYKEADKRLGGWLPGGGTASPVTRAKQEGEQKLAGRIAAQQLSQYPGQPGRFANQGQLLNAVRATTEARANPFSLLTSDPANVKRVAEYYQQNPSLQNQYDLSTNMFLRYLSGTGSKGLEVAPNVGKQIYADIQQQEQKFAPSAYRESLINSRNAPYIKENLLQGNTPVYYGGLSDAVAPHKAQLPFDVGQRWQLQNSLGSFWAKPTDTGYTISDRYNFVYAPSQKEGKGKLSEFKMIPGNITDIGRNLVRSGYGTPYATNLEVNPSGQVIVR
jgi:hypothetical protein